MKIRLLVSSASRLLCRRGIRHRTIEQKLFSTSWSNGYTEIPRDWARSKLRGMSSWQTMLDRERKRWEAACVTYKDLTKLLKARLEDMHHKYPTRRERHMIKCGDYVYFDEDSCVYRFHQSIGEDGSETVFSPGDAWFQDYVIQRVRVSPAQSYLAVTLKGLDREESTCVVVRMEGRPQIVCSIPNVFSCEWITDSVLFHTWQDNLQCRSVYATEFSGESSTRLVYHEEDHRFFVDLYVTRDRHFLTINSNSKTSSEVWLIDCSAPFKPPVLVQKRLPGVVYHVEHINCFLYIVTTYGESAEYKLMKAPLYSDIQHWTPLYQLPAESRLLDMEMLEDHCILFLRQKNELHMSVTPLSGETISRSVKLPSWACALQPDLHPAERTNTICFYLESPVHHPVMFAYSVPENRLSVEASYSGEKSEPRIVRLKAKSKDGTLVPVTVFYKAEIGLGDRPLLVHVYGAYGVDLNMSFKPEKRMLVDDGWILAYCHVRGGGELGCNWHKEGNLEQKQNGLDDLEACIVHLHDVGFSQPCRTSLEAASAGGVLAGALYNARPWLFQALVLEAPFLNVLDTMMDQSLPLTIEEQEEWGDPQTDAQHYRAIQAYCPYQNIALQNYPSVLITAYENDQRVVLSGLLLYVKKLRTAALRHFQTSTLPDWRMPNILLDVHPGGSHCDSLSWEDSLKKVAAQLAFLHKELKL
ncbi:prolyl endopeptidase-like [Anomaloglossus baeobatrachus]|uniref:prolyl endopeptidase-like n=1 Tax=Anomaloglossus baeobatrachus TaxID=238106 RepID=UPI003F4F4BF0